jgi:hypothetical protein
MVVEKDRVWRSMKDHVRDRAIDRGRAVLCVSVFGKVLRARMP